MFSFIDRDDLQTHELLNQPTAWCIGAIAMAWTVWVGSGSFLGIAVGMLVSAGLFLAVAMCCVERTRLRVLRREYADLEDQRAELEKTFNQLPEIAWQSDHTAARTWVNDIWQQKTGQPCEEAHNLDWADFIHDEDRQRCLSAHRLAAVNKENADVEYRLRCADGDYRWMNDRLEPRFSDTDEFLGFIGVTTDIHERKRLEADLRLQIDDLQRATATLNEQAGELADKFEALQERIGESREGDRVKSDFLAALADDLRDPVHQVNNACRMLRTSDVDENQRHQIKRATDASEALIALMERAVELATMDDHDDDAICDEMNLREMIDIVRDRVDSRIESRFSAVRTDVNDEVPALIMSDPLRLRRILTQMWQTAMRFAPKRGTITLDVTRPAHHDDGTDIRFAVTLPKGSVDQDTADRAFYPAESVVGEECGLGLCTAQRLAEQINGTMGLDRKPNGSTTFWLLLHTAEPDNGADGRREHTRLMQEAVRSNLGLVLDLSMGGMRIRCTKLPESLDEVEIFDDEENFTIDAELAWTKKVGFRKHEIGVRFLNMDEVTTSQISRFATRNRLRRILEAA